MSRPWLRLRVRVAAAPLALGAFLCAGCADPPTRGRPVGLAAVDAASACGAVSYAGCCSGQTLFYCAAGVVTSKACAPANLCGWSATFGLYTCGKSAASDPSGKLPRACAFDGAVPPGEGGVDQSKGCGPLSFVGCCQGSTLHFCSGSQVHALSCASAAACGWNATGGYYDCGTAGQADPSGTHPRACGSVLGDSGLKLDGGSAPAADVVPGDLGRDGIRREASLADLRPGLEPRTVDGEAEGGRPGDGQAGLDAVGLDVPSGDAAGPSADDGCSCRVSARPRAPAVLMGLLLLAVAVLRRRRGP